MLCFHQNILVNTFYNLFFYLLLFRKEECLLLKMTDKNTNAGKYNNWLKEDLVWCKRQEFGIDKRLVWEGRIAFSLMWNFSSGQESGRKQYAFAKRTNT